MNSISLCSAISPFHQLKLNLLFEVLMNNIHNHETIHLENRSVLEKHLTRVESQ